MRQTAFSTLCAGLLFFAAALSAADQQLVNMVMPDAKVVAGINVDSARNSQFGTYLVSHISASDPGFQKFVHSTGFNPMTDLREVLLATTAASGGMASNPVGAVTRVTSLSESYKGLVLARGNFDPAKISAAAQTEGHQTVEMYSGATLISDPKDSAASAMAFVGNSLLVAGDLASVKAALDRRSKTNTLDPDLTSKMNSLSASQDAWAVSIVPLSSMGGGSAADPSLQGALNGDLFKKISQTSGGVKFGSTVQLSTEMVALDEKNAAALGDVVKFLAGMVSMNAGTANGAPPAIVSLLQSLSVQTQGKVVNVNLSAPEAQLEGLFESMTKGTKKLGAAQI